MISFAERGVMPVNFQMRISRMKSKKRPLELLVVFKDKYVALAVILVDTPVAIACFNLVVYQLSTKQVLFLSFCCYLLFLQFMLQIFY